MGGPGQGKGPLGEKSDRAPSDRRARRRDPREVPAEGDLRDQRARRRDRARCRRRLACRCSARGTRSPTSSCSSTRPQPSEAQEGVAFFGRAGQAVLKSLQRLRVDPMAVYGTNCVKLADGAADEEARGWLTRELHIVQPKLVVRDGRRRARLPERPRVPARRSRSSRRSASSSGSPRRSRRSSSRTSTRSLDEAAGEDRVLERLQGARLLVGGAARLTDRPARASRSRRWLAAGAAWYFAADSLPGISLWWDVALLAFVLMPARLPASTGSCCRSATARGLLPLARLALAVLAVLAEVGDLEVLANVAKLAAVTFFAFWFLGLFEELCAGRDRRADRPVRRRLLRVPRADRPHRRAPLDGLRRTSRSTSRCRASRTARGSGIPDLLFFALFLAAAVRFRLRPGWTWLAMVAALGATIAIAVWADVSRPAGAAGALARVPGAERGPDLGAAPPAKRGRPRAGTVPDAPSSRPCSSSATQAVMFCDACVSFACRSRSPASAASRACAASGVWPGLRPPRRPRPSTCSRRRPGSRPDLRGRLVRELLDDLGRFFRSVPAPLPLKRAEYFWPRFWRSLQFRRRGEAGDARRRRRLGGGRLGGRGLGGGRLGGRLLGGRRLGRRCLGRRGRVLAACRRSLPPPASGQRAGRGTRAENLAYGAYVGLLEVACRMRERPDVSSAPDQAQHDSLERGNDRLADQPHHLEIGVVEMLEEDPLDPGAARTPAACATTSSTVPTSSSSCPRSTAGSSSRPLRSSRRRARSSASLSVAADAARGHQREGDRLPPLALARLRDRGPPLAALLHRGERGVVLVGPACREPRDARARRCRP